MNEMPDADVVVDLRQVVGTIDYFAPLVIGRIFGEYHLPRFTGSVVAADPVAEGVFVRAMGGVSLVERLIGAIAARGIEAPEMFHVLARSGGLDEDQLQISGLDDLPREVFEVLAALDAVEVERPIDFGGVQFLPPARAIAATESLDLSEDLRAQFSDATAYALTHVTATRAIDAEEIGLRRIDVALGWLTARLRYGAATLPDGRPLRFVRRDSRARPTRRDLVFVRGLTTTRQWLRTPESMDEPRAVDISGDVARFPRDFPNLSTREHQALLAFGRAARERDLLARVHALWEAIEFYAGTVKPPALFTKNDLKDIRAALPARLNAEQRDRVDEALGWLNRPPLMKQLRRMLDEEEVPVSDGEIELLLRLRRLRNDVVHGRSSEMPRADDVDRAVSVVARVLVYHLARRATAGAVVL